MKKILAVLAVVILATGAVLALVSCESADYTVGICQLITHDALDAATKGFKDALKEEMDKAGKTIVFKESVGDGSPTTCTQMVSTLVAQNVDLILANATDPLISASKATTKIPVLGTSVTAYQDALQIDDFSGTVGGNISGTSDLAPLDKQADMILELVPDAKTVGLLYCSAESNSKFQIDIVKKYLQTKGVSCIEIPFSETDMLANALSAKVEQCDAIYIPTDNTVAAAAKTVDPICSEARVPVIAGEEGICKGCGIATLSISYYDLGVATGKMAAKILLQGEDISKMPIEYAAQSSPKYIKSRCEQLGINVPDNYEEIVISEQ